MSGDFIIRPQRYPTSDGELPLTYGIFLETTETFDGIEYWQDGGDVFIAYSWTRAGAERAIQELRQRLWSHR